MLLQFDAVLSLDDVEVGSKLFSHMLYTDSYLVVLQVTFLRASNIAHSGSMGTRLSGSIRNKNYLGSNPPLFVHLECPVKMLYSDQPFLFSWVGRQSLCAVLNLRFPSGTKSFILEVSPLVANPVHSASHTTKLSNISYDILTSRNMFMFKKF